MTGKEALTKVDYLLTEYVCRLKPENSLYCEDDDGSEYIDIIEKELDEADSLKNMLHNINLCEALQPDVDDFKKLELLEQLETLKNYYPPFKLFLKDMFEKGYNKDLNKIKEWLEDDD